jgi:hypothetical protein
MGLSEDRLTKNDAKFRDANERIYGSAREYHVTEAIPFLCECADPACTVTIRLSADEYDRIRGNPRRFFGAPGHAEPVRGSLEIAEHHPTYDVFVMVGRAAEIAEELQPRRPL